MYAHLFPDPGLETKLFVHIVQTFIFQQQAW